MKKRPLQVVLRVREPSIIELIVGERVQMDRLTTSPRGPVPERQGGLLEPGKTTIALTEGHYCFKTLSDANFHVVRGGVDIHSVAQTTKGDPWPDPSAPVQNPPGAKGDEIAGEFPAFIVE